MSLLPLAAGLSRFTRSFISSRYLTSLRTVSHPFHTHSIAMARQFFVGGNFKLNPTSIEAKKGLLKVLNEATIDPAVGERF